MGMFKKHEMPKGVVKPESYHVPPGERYRFKTSIPPSVNHLYGTTKTGKRYMTKRGREWKNNAAYAYILSNARAQRPFSNDCFVEVLIVNNKQHPVDLDNIFKALFDAMSGVAWVDDKQVKGFRIETLELVPFDDGIDVEIRTR